MVYCWKSKPLEVRNHPPPKPTVEQHVVYFIYYNGTLVLPYNGKGRGVLIEMMKDENKRCFFILDT